MASDDPVNRHELIALVATRSGHRRDTVDQVLRGLTDELLYQMATGRGVNLHGIARFVPVQQGQQRSRNPNTGEPVVVPPRVRPVIRSGAVLTRVTEGADPPPKAAGAVAAIRAKTAREAIAALGTIR